MSSPDRTIEVQKIYYYTARTGEAKGKGSPDSKYGERAFFLISAPFEKLLLTMLLR